MNTRHVSVNFSALVLLNSWTSDACVLFCVTWMRVMMSGNFLVLYSMPLSLLIQPPSHLRSGTSSTKHLHLPSKPRSAVLYILTSCLYAEGLASRIENLIDKYASKGKESLQHALVPGGTCCVFTGSPVHGVCSGHRVHTFTHSNTKRDIERSPFTSVFRGCMETHRTKRKPKVSTCKTPHIPFSRKAISEPVPNLQLDFLKARKLVLGSREVSTLCCSITL